MVLAGRDITVLAGGDCDGDDVAVTANPGLVEYLLATEPWFPFYDALQRATVDALPKKAPEAWRQGVARSAQYIDYVLRVPTINGKGIATALSEKGQETERFLCLLISMRT